MEKRMYKTGGEPGGTLVSKEQQHHEYRTDEGDCRDEGANVVPVDGGICSIHCVLNSLWARLRSYNIRGRHLNAGDGHERL